MPISESVVIAAIAMAGGAIIGPFVQQWLNRRKTAVETEGSVAFQWKTWADELKSRVDALEADVEQLKRELAEEERTNRHLRAKVEEQSRLLRSVVRWAITLRDELLKAGAAVPPTPIDVESAMTSLDTER